MNFMLTILNKKHHFKCEKCSSGKKVDKHGGFGECFLHSLCDSTPFPARFRCQPRRGRWAWRGLLWGCIVDFDSKIFKLLHPLNLN
ncbi:unnamed protein product, partial [Vitis vinifera]